MRLYASQVEWVGVLSIMLSYSVLAGLAVLSIQDDASSDFVLQTLSPSAAAVLGAVGAYIKENIFHNERVRARRFTIAGAIVIVGGPLLYATVGVAMLTGLATDNLAHVERLHQMFGGMTAVFSAVYVFVAVQVYNPSGAVKAESHPEVDAV